MHLVPGPPRQVNKPAPTVFCYICGRQFGTRSIDIHIPQCLKKWEAENERLPKAKRRPPPVKPDIVIHGGAINAELSNEAAWAASQTNSMIECQHCKRRFNPDRLEAHQRSCTAERPAKRVGTKL